MRHHSDLANGYVLFAPNQTIDYGHYILRPDERLSRLPTRSQTERAKDRVLLQTLKRELRGQIGRRLAR